MNKWTADHGTIYQISCQPNSVAYLGVTTAIVEHRWDQHRMALTKHKHPNHGLQADWDSYGADAFMFEELETFPDIADCKAFENKWLDQRRAQSVVLYNSPNRSAARAPEVIRAVHAPSDPLSEQSPWLTVDEAAAITGLPTTSIYHWIHTGKLPYYHLGGGSLIRIRRSDLLPPPRVKPPPAADAPGPA